ncbi:MAG: hypothetical protein ABIW46_06975 [Acidimicrobiales bacterium]
MTPPRRRPRPSRPAGAREPRPAPAVFWAAVQAPPLPAVIVPAADPTALLRSLGPPPLPGHASADRYLATVIERAAGLATALAAAAGLLHLAEGDEGD